MSDPVTNVEIEDVLSSIRRLVADDARVAPPVKKAVPERLVLTPAQRVKDDVAPEKATDDPLSEADTEAAPAARPVATQKQEYPQDLPIDEVPGDAKLSDFGEVEGAFPDIDDFESVEVQDKADNDRPEDFEVQDAAHDESEADKPWLELGRLIEVEVAAALKDVPSSEDVDDARSEEEVHAEPEVSDPLSDAELSPAETEFDEELALAPFAVHDDVSVSDSDTPDTDDVHIDEVPTPPQTLEEKVAALGRLVARDSHEFEEERDTANADELTAVSRPMTWSRSTTNEDAEYVEDVPTPQDDIDVSAVQPDTADSVESEPPDMSVEVAIEPEVEPEPEPEVEKPSDATAVVVQSELPQTPGLQLDEDMLRDLVGDIVRQELQGALGERITRNVRKLVRREIHRMLISQEME